MYRCVFLDHLQQDETIVEKVIGSKVQSPVDRHASAVLVPCHGATGVQRERVHDDVWLEPLLFNKKTPCTRSPPTTAARSTGTPRYTSSPSAMEPPRGSKQKPNSGPSRPCRNAT